MFAVKGIYDGTIIRLEPAVIPVEEQYEVIVTFVKPVSPAEPESVSAPADSAMRSTAYQRLQKYRKTLNRQVDYKKESAEALDERYGYTH